MKAHSVQSIKIIGLAFVLLTIIVAFVFASVDGTLYSPLGGAVSSSGVRPYPNFPFPTGRSPLPYDEQVGATFTQDFTSLEFNVTAVEQVGPDGNGPAHLLNGLADSGYWYQVGLSWRWPANDGTTQPGFSMNFEVFDPYGNSVFPTSGGGGIDNLSVSQGDVVLLSLTFNRGNVIMEARDWNTTSTRSESYSATGGSYFVGLPNSISQAGFFTGLMTEEYQSSPYYGAGAPVFYTTHSTLSSAWMWADEWDVDTGARVFNENTSSPVQLYSSTAEYFASNGTAELADSHGLATGLTPVVFPTAHPETVYGQPGHQTNVTIDIQDSGSITLQFLNVSITTNFYNNTTSTPFTFRSSTGRYNIPIALPSGLSLGDYTVTINISSWQYLEPQANEWIQLPPTSFNETLVVSNTPHVPAPQGPGPGSGNGPNITGGTSTSSLQNLLQTLLPWILSFAVAYLVAVSIASIMFLRVERIQRKHSTSQTRNICPTCGNGVAQGALACQTCNGSLASSSPPLGSPSSQQG